MKRIVLALVLLLTVAVSACQGAAKPNTGRTPVPSSPTQNPTAANNPQPTARPSGGGMQVVQSNRPRLAAPAAANADLPALVDGNNAFAWSLYQKLAATDGNLFYSPYSISLALAMTYAGANGETARQMADALHYTLPQARLHPALNSLDQALASRGQGAQGKDSQPFRLRIANAIWGQQGFAFLQPFLDTLAENYGAGLRTLDFGDPENARGVINRYISDQTEKRIPELIAPRVLNSDTRLVLTNAIYFNAAWNKQFQKESTHDGQFHLLDGQTVTVPMMFQQSGFSYAKGDGYQAIELPYDGREIAMLLIVPDSGQFQKIESSLRGEQFAAIVKSLQGQQVELTMPRWKFDSSFTLSDALKALGMTDAFDANAADFSGMDGKKDLLIQQVVHKAFVAVDESGTEAAAATAVIVGLTSAPAEIVRLTIDRPFLFAIRDLPTGQILFVGRVVNPS